MFIGTFQLSASTSCWFRQECQTAEVSGLFRTALAEALYHREQLSSRAAAQKLLPKLVTLLEVSLPATQVAMPESHPALPTGFPDQTITGRLSELDTLSVECVTDAERPHWEAMIASHHPAGWTRSPGGRILYSQLENFKSDNSGSPPNSFKSSVMTYACITLTGLSWPT